MQDTLSAKLQNRFPSPLTPAGAEQKISSAFASLLLCQRDTQPWSEGELWVWFAPAEPSSGEAASRLNPALGTARDTTRGPGDPTLHGVALERAVEMHFHTQDESPRLCQDRNEKVPLSQALP